MKNLNTPVVHINDHRHDLDIMPHLYSSRTAFFSSLLACWYSSGSSCKDSIAGTGPVSPAFVKKPLGDGAGAFGLRFNSSCSFPVPLWFRNCKSLGTPAIVARFVNRVCRLAYSWGRAFIGWSNIIKKGTHMKELAMEFKFLQLSSKSRDLDLNFTFTGNEELVHLR